YGEVDPYFMALLAVDEALRNVTAVGADPNRTALLDNFCWGDPNRPDRLGGLVRAARGCHDAAVGFRAPFISGKDSLFNEYRAPDGTSHAIPGTLLISAIGIVPDVGRIASMHLREPGNFLYLIGRTADEMGGSLLLRLRGERGGDVPRVEPRRRRSILLALHRAIRAGLVQACHDLSEGGLAVAAAEMAIAGERGAAIDLDRTPGVETGLPVASVLFAESATRFLVEVRPDDAPAFERALGRASWGRIGRVTEDARLTMRAGERIAIDDDVAALRRAWRTPLGAEDAR
ncbi:MAG TPA: AIR synthase-related protein, partial [Thermomicrobiales bacterium]|nr:AIR synthase-related protein [Thermomicrobiales bacterium]